jgi:hypothetical protein
MAGLFEIDIEPVVMVNLLRYRDEAVGEGFEGMTGADPAGCPFPEGLRENHLVSLRQGLLAETHGCRLCLGNYLVIKVG